MLIKSVLFLLLATSAFAHWDSGYFRNANDGFNARKTWMKEIPDSRRLSELAIPGTHNTATFGFFVDSSQCQTMDFDQQLRTGIRFFDIRFRHHKDHFPLFHGIDYLRKDFEHVLQAMQKFLNENPSETVLFRMREERDPAENTRSKLETLKAYLSGYNRFLQTTNRGITLGEARGKFILFSDNTDFHGLGIVYSSSNIQDDHKVSTNWDLYSKWEKVMNHLYRARDGDSGTFYINYLSASGGSFPYFIASGHSSPGTSAPRLWTGISTTNANKYPDFPRMSCLGKLCSIYFEGTNMLTRILMNSINCCRNKRTVGIIMSDFPGDGLIGGIVENNWILK